MKYLLFCLNSFPKIVTSKETPNLATYPCSILLKEDDKERVLLRYRDCEGIPNRVVSIGKRLCPASWGDIRDAFRALERRGEHGTAYVTFTEDSFLQKYSKYERTYAVSSDNKAFQPNMGGYSIYGSSVDGKDPMVRLERYMAAEHGGQDGWKIESSYLLENIGPTVLCGNFMILRQRKSDGELVGLGDEELRFWADMFFWPIMESSKEFMRSANEYFDDLWAQLGNIAIDEEDRLDESFLFFPKGTSREDVWIWFDTYSPCGVAKLMYR